MTLSLQSYVRIYREPLLQMARHTRQAAAPRWSHLLTVWFSQAEHLPDTALAREQVVPIARTILRLTFCHTVNAVMGSVRHPVPVSLTCSESDTALAALRDLLDCVAARDPDLAVWMAQDIRTETRDHREKVTALLRRRFEADAHTAR